MQETRIECQDKSGSTCLAYRGDFFSCELLVPFAPDAAHDRDLFTSVNHTINCFLLHLSGRLILRRSQDVSYSLAFRIHRTHSSSRFALCRSASRLLTTRSTSLISTSRTYSSFSAPSSRIAQRSLVSSFQRRWATNEAEAKVPISEEESAQSEELENATEADKTLAAQAGSAPPAFAETANATEATEEALPAAETGERFSAESNETSSSAPHAGLFDRKPTLYVGNLFFDVTETDLVKEFGRFGVVSKCRIVRDSRGLSKGYVSSSKEIF